MNDDVLTPTAPTGPAQRAQIQVVPLKALPIVALALAYARRGIGRVSSAVIIAGYLIFVVVIAR